jgi:hypothetical protein
MSPVLVCLVEVTHHDQTYRLAVMPYLQDQITQILSGLGIPHRIIPTPMYEDYRVMRSFVVHPATEERLWLENKEALQRKGFCYLVKEEPRHELVTQANPQAN